MAGRWANGGTGAGSLGLVDLAIARLHATAGNDAAARAVVQERGRGARTGRRCRRGWPDRSSIKASSSARRRCLPRPRRRPGRGIRPPDRRRPGGPSPGLTGTPRIRQGAVSDRRAHRRLMRTDHDQSRHRELPPGPPRAARQRRAARTRRQPVPPTTAPARRGAVGTTASPTRSSATTTSRTSCSSRPSPLGSRPYPEIAPKLEGDHADLDVLLDDLRAALAVERRPSHCATLAAELRDHLDEHLDLRGPRDRAALRTPLSPGRVRRAQRPRRAHDALQAAALHRAVADVAPRRRASASELLASVPKAMTFLWMATRRRYGRLASRRPRLNPTRRTKHRRRSSCPTSMPSPAGSTP